MRFKKKIVIIPFITGVLFTLGMTFLVILYSYGAVGNYTVNEDNFNSYALSDYYNDSGNAQTEIEKNIRYNAIKYEKVSQTTYDKDFTASIFAATTESSDTTIKTINIYFTDVNYKKYTNRDEFEVTSGIVNSDSKIEILYIKGTGEKALEKLNEAVDEYRIGSLNSARLITAYVTNVKDNAATGLSTTAYVYAAELLSSADTDLTDYSDLESYYDDASGVGSGYTYMLINSKVSGTTENIVRVIGTFELTDLLDVENFEAKTTVTNGYKKDWTLAGYSYLDYVMPTLIWQGILTFVICGILAFLFYAIWGTEDAPSAKEVAIQKIKNERKQK